MRVLVATTLFWGMCWAGVAVGQDDPIGEAADYQLDNDSSRTSSMIRSGTMGATVTGELPEEEGQRVYEVTLDYDLNIRWMGRQQGSCLLPVRQEFFTDAFLERLRAGEIYESPYFKAVHQGFGDARNLDGNFYENCDKVFLYDVDPSLCEMLMSNLAGSDDDISPYLEDVEITVHMHPAAPVVGAVKIDMSGRHSGFDFKAGGDFVAP